MSSEEKKTSNKNTRNLHNIISFKIEVLQRYVQTRSSCCLSPGQNIFLLRRLPIEKTHRLEAPAGAAGTKLAFAGSFGGITELRNPRGQKTSSVQKKVLWRTVLHHHHLHSKTSNLHQTIYGGWQGPNMTQPPITSRSNKNPKHRDFTTWR